MEELGPFVTEKDVKIREKGICALSIILFYLPSRIIAYVHTTVYVIIDNYIYLYIHI